MTRLETEQLAYEQYQLDWMKDNGYSLFDLIKELNEIYLKDPEYKESTPFSLYRKFLQNGFEHHNNFLSFSEFLNDGQIYSTYLYEVNNSIEELEYGE